MTANIYFFENDSAVPLLLYMYPRAQRLLEPTGSVHYTSIRSTERESTGSGCREPMHVGGPPYIIVDVGRAGEEYSAYCTQRIHTKAGAGVSLPLIDPRCVEDQHRLALY